MDAEPPFDLAVIGGGINGSGIARDATGRGARVLLLEAGDLAQGTSSASTKLIHGGLRYLEHREFALVRESLKERERLWRIAPHLIRPMRFVLPHAPGLRPRWLLRLGLFLYDHIGGRELLPASDSISLAKHPAGAALRSEYLHGFVYSDCRVDDARLVILNARDAADRGAQIRTRCPVTALQRKSGADGESLWHITTPQGSFHARAVVNAAGPSALDIPCLSSETSGLKMRLVRGSHIVVPKLFDHEFAYFFQLPDGRILFAIPYEQDFTLIGTTDCDHQGSPLQVQASDREIAYLCEAVNRYFRKAIRPADVVWTYSGVRPLVDDGSGRPEAATRGYRLDLSDKERGAALLTVLGGKITTYRHLSEQAIDLLATRLPALSGARWTTTQPLPGGDFPTDGLDALIGDLRGRYPFLNSGWAKRLARAYGSAAVNVLGDARTRDDCGEAFGADLTAREVTYLIAREWAQTAEDVLWRRSKLGLRLSAAQVRRLDEWMQPDTSRNVDSSAT